MREHKGANVFLIFITSTDNTQALKKAENGSEDHFSTLCVLKEVFRPPSHLTCNLHHITPDIQTITPPSFIQLPF